jgi:hypothetical protein
LPHIAVRLNIVVFVYAILAHYRRINVREHRSGNTKMDNSEKLAIFGKQDTGRIQINQKAYHYAQANTNNINKAWALLQTTGGKD